VSERTRALVDADGLRDLGLHRLKDLSEPQRLYQLGDREFPPLRTLHATNLPTQPNRLVGRERELAEAAALLREHRLVTLTGPGGSGKTRLALQLAADAVGEFADGVYWVPLQALTDPELVVPTIARVVGAAVPLSQHLADRRALLLLDNVEQVIDAAPALAEILAATTRAVLLVTSREPLRVAGEHRYPVEPLPESDAAELFVERARAVDPTFEPSAVVAEICSRVDGLPLALELAAARLTLFSADDLLARLDAALPLLTTRTRDLPERQRTLRATIAWSHDLLDHDERRLFRRLAVFAGGADVESVLHVCQVDVDVLQSLVDRSLVRRFDGGRVGMLETVHEYAGELLAAADELDEFRRRHAERYAELAEAANLGSLAEGIPDFDVARRELANIRAALAWAVDRSEPELGLRLVCALDFYWVAADPFECRRWLDRLLDLDGDVRPDVHAHAILTRGGMTFIVGDFERGTELHEQALAEYEAIGHALGTAHVKMRLVVPTRVGGDLEGARALAVESLQANRELGSARGEVAALGTLAEVEWDCGNHERALQLARESAAAAVSCFPWWRAGMLYDLTEWSLQLGRRAEARRFALDAFDASCAIGDRMRSVYLAALLARIEAEEGRAETAGVLWGAVEAEERRAPVGQWEDEREAYADPVLDHAGEAFDRGRTAGAPLTLEEAVRRVAGEA
jgi:predicted ATPase